MKLFPSQPEVRLYEEGFGAVDLLKRQHAGKRLSELLEKVDDSVVVALDGPWGSGKSHFLKRWVGAHNLENGGTATTVYFDAFANDYLDDPLIGLTGIIGERLPPTEKSKWQTAKDLAVKLSRPVFRIGLAAATAGATEIAAPVVDAAIEAGANEAANASEAFWRREDGRKAAMTQFRHCLEQLAVPAPKSSEPGKRLIIVVDELDRCRPDYALSVLEVIKHFFSVPRVHFVLGVNMTALGHMVKVRYGTDVNSVDYLKRFVSLTMHLPAKLDGQSSALKFFETCAKDMELPQQIISVAQAHLSLLTTTQPVTLRDIEKILTHLVLLPKRSQFSTFVFGWQEIIISLISMRILDPDLFRSTIIKRSSIEEIDSFFGITTEMIFKDSQNPSLYNHRAYILHGLWLFILSNGKEPQEDAANFSRSFDSFGLQDNSRILTDIERDFFGLFEVPN